MQDLSDVGPHDWAWIALSDIARKAGDRLSFGGAERLTRLQFAVRLSKLLDQLTRPPASEALTEADLSTLRRLQSEYTAELETTGGRIESIEVRQRQVEARSFSGATRMTGQVIFGLGGLAGGTRAGSSRPLDARLDFGGRVRLTFDTNFSRNDRLRVRIQAGNLPNFGSQAGTDTVRLGVGGNTAGRFNVSRLEYRFRLSEGVQVTFQALGAQLDNFAEALNPEVGSTTNGAISRFGQRNAIYRLVSGTGLGVEWEINRQLTFSAAYIADFGSVAEDDDPEDDQRPTRTLPDGALLQLAYTPNRTSGLALTYIRTFNALDTGTGSDLANDPFDEQSRNFTADSYGLQAFYRIAPGFSVSGWFGLTETRADDLPGKPGASITNWAVALAFPDLGGRGNLGGFVIGQPPRAVRNDLGARYQDPDAALHLEVFYRLRLADRISITPGLLTLINPEHDRRNPAITVGTVRVTFEF